MREITKEEIIFVLQKKIGEVKFRKFPSRYTSAYGSVLLLLEKAPIEINTSKNPWQQRRTLIEELVHVAREKELQLEILSENRKGPWGPRETNKKIEMEVGREAKRFCRENSGFVEEIFQQVKNR